jgi:hypothetical protein
MRVSSGILLLVFTSVASSCNESATIPSSISIASASPRAALTLGAPVYPDVIEAVPSHLQIQNDHQREWLRFSTTHINIGDGNLQIQRRQHRRATSTMDRERSFIPTTNATKSSA